MQFDIGHRGHRGLRENKLLKDGVTVQVSVAVRKVFLCVLCVLCG
jgi:hypothetical protein